MRGHEHKRAVLSSGGDNGREERNTIEALDR